MAASPSTPTSIVVTETFVVVDHHGPKRLKRRRREATEELSVLGNVYTARAVLVSSIPIQKKGGVARPPLCRACSPLTLWITYLTAFALLAYLRACQAPLSLEQLKNFIPTS
jgi:hypothetical protein